MSVTQLGLLIPPTEIFPDSDNDFDTFIGVLNGLSRMDTLFWCARVNLVVSDAEVDHATRQRFGLKQFLGPQELNRVDDFVRRHGDAQEVIAFCRGQLLELIRWVVLYCEDHPDDGTTFEDPQVRRRFAQAALIAGDIWQRRVYPHRFSLDGGIDVARRRSLGDFRKGIEGSLETPDLAKSLGRGWTLFHKYLPQYYQTFDSEFLLSTGLSIEDYFISLGTMITSFVNPKLNSGLFDANAIGASTPFTDTLQRFIKLESQTADELRQALWGEEKPNQELHVKDYDYRPLREKPILRSIDGRAITLDPVFFSEKASVGPLFLLPEQVRPRAFAGFGHAFEAYSGDMLERMFPDISQAANKRLQRNLVGKDVEGNEFEIDACLNDVTEIVVFEMKAGFMPEGTILAQDHETFLHQLRRKYAWSEKNKRIGTGQLAKVISILATDKLLGGSFDFCKAQTVYPILLVHDLLLGAPGYGAFLASEFRELLSPDDELRSGQLLKGDLRIMPLIVLTVDDLENLETSIEHFGFRDVLSSYSQFCPDRSVSFHSFLASEGFKGKIYANKSIAAAGLDILETVRLKVFANMISDTLEVIGDDDSE